MISTRGLPPFRGIMAVDAVGFSRNRSVTLPDLSAAIPELLGRAFARCGMSEIWEARSFPQGTGDGYLFGVTPEHVPFVLDPLLDRLQEVLEEQDLRLRTQDRQLRLRLRAAVHLGTVADEGDARDGIGTPTNDTFRLLDSEPIRQALNESNPDITLLAAIVSQRVFEDVVRAGYTGELHPDRFEQVTAEVVDKDFVQPAWLYVPKRSRRHGEISETEPTGTSAPASAPATTTIHGNVGNSISGGTIAGDAWQVGGNVESGRDDRDRRHRP